MNGDPFAASRRSDDACLVDRADQRRTRTRELLNLNSCVGAAQVSGGEPWNVSGSAYSSLSQSAGGVATSPQTCVNAAYPTFRFFAVAGTPGSSAAVSVR